MGTELTTGKRAAMLHLNRPSKEQLGLEAYQTHKSRVAFELEVVSTKLDRFGWSQMANAMKDRLTLDWTDVLSPYHLDEITRAIAVVMAKKPKDATNEQQVKKEILASRAGMWSNLPREPEKEPIPIKKMTPEAQQAMIDEIGFACGAVKSFDAKPEERE